MKSKRIYFFAFLSGLLGALAYDQGIKRFSTNGRPHSLPSSLESSAHLHGYEVKPTPAKASHSTTSDAKNALGDLPDLAEAARQSTESVVFIRTTTQSQYWTGTWMDWFFGGPQTNAKIEAGSGVIYTKEGHIITNHHVIEGADQIEVVHKKRVYKATLVGADPSTDLAVIKVNEPHDFKLLPMGNSDEVQVGEWVLAIGNPFNLTSTVTAGIISAKGRNINLLKDRFPIESFIQTDAAINPGNSGGALVSAKGALVGINTAILSKTGSYAGYGFAVPVNVVRKVAEDLIRYRKVQKAYTGLVLSDLDESSMKRLNYESLAGVWVRHVLPNGAGDQAGVLVDDIILAVDGRPIQSQAELEELIGYSSPGDVLALELWSGKRKVRRSITLLNGEGTTSLLRRHLYYAKRLRAELEAVSQEERRLLGIRQGVRVVRAEGGLLKSLPKGLIITHINQKAILTPQALEATLLQLKGSCYIQGIDQKGNRVTYRAVL